MGTITEWLTEHDLLQYIAVLAQNAIDIDVLFDLTEADLEKLGIPLGDRKRMLKAFASTARTSVPLVGSGTRGERRHLTVLFCDLVGSTGIAVELDPEDLSEVVRSFQDVCTRVIKAFGGCVGRFMGDGVLVYFGAPRIIRRI